MFVDVAVGVLVVALAILGFVRGLFSQAWGLGALLGAWWATPRVIQLIQGTAGFPEEPTTVFGGFLLGLGVGFALYLALILIGRLIEVVLIEQLKLISAGNKVLGGLVGMAKGALLTVMALWMVQFAATYLFDEEPALIDQLRQSYVAQEVGGYNPLNFIYLNRLKPYIPAETGEEARPLPEKVATPELERLVADEAFAQAVHERDYLAILSNPSYQGALGDPRVARRLNSLY